MLSFSLFLLREQALLLIARELCACAASREIRQLREPGASTRTKPPKPLFSPPLAALFSPSDPLATMFS